MVKKELHKLRMEDVAIHQERQKRVATKRKLEIMERELERAKAQTEMRVHEKSLN